MNNTLYLGDCLQESEKIQSGSIDLIVTDLPYGTVKGAGLDGWDKKKTEWDEVIPTGKIMQIANRILRKNGKMVLFAQEPFTTELINGAIPNLPFCYRAIWQKDHFANSLLAKKAMVSYYEDVLIFSKKHDHEGLHPLRAYSLMLKEYTKYSRLNFKKILGHYGFQHFLEGDKTSSQFSLCTEKTYHELIQVFGIDKMDGFKPFAELQEIDNNFKAQYSSTFNLWEGKKYKSNILTYKKDYDGYHPTQKPVLLLEDLIKTFSNEGDTIADLTMGSGSTGVACVNTNRRFIGIEKEKKYFDIAKQRIQKAQQKLF
jgi:site-specific DNA-methyltransferase (adenine-specific)